MLVLKKAGLVYLANPKTATQSLRAALAPFAKGTPDQVLGKHINAQGYHSRWADKLVNMHGRAFRSFGVMRAPMDHAGSWYRYRQRDALKGHENSTQGISFAQFIEARLADDPPPFARIGRQDRFLGYLDEGDHPVDFIFDYAQLDVLQSFLQDRLGAAIALPHHNVSPKAESDALDLPDDLMARFRAVHANEFRLYTRVQGAGMMTAEAQQILNNSAH